MKGLLALALLVSLLCLPSTAQSRGGGGGPRSTTPISPKVPTPGPTPESTTMYLSGKVVVDDGSVLTDSAAIQTICKGQKRIETHTDSRGNFSFQFGGRTTTTSEIGFDSETSSTLRPGSTDRRDLRDCQLQATVPGFTSNIVELTGRFSGSESGDVGRIVLHRLNNVEGSTISVTTAQAPESARRAFEKGQQQQKQSKWDEAQKSFEKAVAIYPKFAVAWFELGRVQLQKSDAASARQSFQQSIAADAKYVSPYLGLTQIATRAQNWRELSEVTAKVLALNAVSFPEVWLSNSFANYFLQDFTVAEKSARAGLQVDSGHRLPKLEYVLGMILVKKPDYEDAARHLKAFLSLATEPAEIAEGKKQLDEVTRLMAAK